MPWRRFHPLILPMRTPTRVRPRNAVAIFGEVFAGGQTSPSLVGDGAFVAFAHHAQPVSSVCGDSEHDQQPNGGSASSHTNSAANIGARWVIASTPAAHVNASAETWMSVPAR